MIAIFLTYWSGDRDAAARLVRMMADVESARRTDVRLRLIARYDCPYLDPDDVSYAASKFDVSWARTTTRWDGWPGGCNAMALDALRTAKQALHENGWDDANGILLLEPDNVPLAKDWLNQIMAEWETALADGKWMMGSWRNSGGALGHVNGNCVVVPDFYTRANMEWHVGRDLAWDCAIMCKRLAERQHRSGLFLNRFQTRNATEEQLRTPEFGERAPVVVHGVKDTSAEEIARRWMKL